MQGGLEQEAEDQTLRFRLAKENGGWSVLGSRGRLIYRDTNYAKAVGVYDFLTEWRFISREFLPTAQEETK
jgi:hypothetical protein